MLDSGKRNIHLMWVDVRKKYQKYLLFGVILFPIQDHHGAAEFCPANRFLFNRIRTIFFKKKKKEKIDHVSKLKERSIKSKENDIVHIVVFIVVFRFEIFFFKLKWAFGMCLHHTLSHTIATALYCSKVMQIFGNSSSSSTIILQYMRYISIFKHANLIDLLVYV